jgi:hypothetical protein
MPTTNNNWPTPVATDLVKDGWEAIKDLGDAIDTTLGVYAPPATGLTLINTTSFSAVAAQSINDVFSATYRNYKILINISSASAAGSLNFRLRVAGSDNSSSVYARAIWGQRASGANGEIGSATGSTFFAPARLNTLGNYTATDITLYDSFTTAQTKITHISHSHDSTSFLSTMGGGVHDSATSFTGFSIYPDSGTITGSVSVYGFNN